MEGLDQAIQKLRKTENRRRLAQATARYFEQLNREAATEENALAKDMTSGAGMIEFEH